jgi:hypothetical protein
MENFKKEWTHNNVKITDIRKLSKFYMFTIDNDIINSPLLVKDEIFDERIKPYFLKEVSRITREEILSVKWNMFITKGCYIKINRGGEIQEFNMDADKYYISYLEISGPLGGFSSICREIHHEEK